MVAAKGAADGAADGAATAGGPEVTVLLAAHRPERHIAAQLDSRHMPCNMVELMPRLLEK